MHSLKKGTLDVVILSALEHDDLYGLEIVDRIDRLTSDAFTFKSGTLYPILHRLEAAKLVTSRWSPSTMGAKRKYYHLTRKGRNVLEKRRAEWADFRDNIDILLRPA